MREAFEAAILDRLDDRAVYAAYSDWLEEQGDPRGEFIAVQLALEVETKPKSERKKLATREKSLLEAHEREWLGDLAPHLLERVPARRDYDPNARPGTEHRWRRGFLAELKVDCLTVALAQALADAPAVRFLQKLHVVSTAYYLGMQAAATPRRVPAPPEYRDYNEWLELLGAPLLRNLRVFQMGDTDGEPPESGWMDNHTYAPGIDRLIAEMLRIEELHLLCKEYDSGALFSLPNLKNLRVLRIYALGDPNASEGFEIRLDALARNAALGTLTHLLIHPHFADDRSFLPLDQIRPLVRSKRLKSLSHLQLRLSDMGDEGCHVIVKSGILKQLRWLDLRHGCITDDGARMLASCTDCHQLEHLDLSRNAVTRAGLKALHTAGVKAIANNPLTDQELAEHEYLHEGDFE